MSIPGCELNISVQCFVKKNGANKSKDRGPSLGWFREGSLEEVILNCVPKVE